MSNTLKSIGLIPLLAVRTIPLEGVVFDDLHGLHRRKIDHLTPPPHALPAQRVPTVGAVLQGMRPNLRRRLIRAPMVAVRRPFLARAGLRLALGGMPVRLHTGGHTHTPLRLAQRVDLALQLHDQFFQAADFSFQRGIFCPQVLNLVVRFDGLDSITSCLFCP